MKNLSFFTEEFSVNKTSAYLLSLQFDDKGYAYTIIDSIKNSYVAIKYVNFDEKIADKFYTDKIKYIISSDPFLTKNYKAVNFSFISQKTTLVPESLFDKKKLTEYFEFNHILDEYEELHFNYLNKTEAYNIFAIPSEITTLLVNRFPEIRFYNQASVFIENALKKSENIKFKLPIIKVNINSGFFEVSVIISDKLSFFNTFSFRNSNDFIYFLLNALSQMNLKASNSHFYLSGLISSNSEFYKTVSKYIPNVKFSSLSGKTKYFFNDVPEHILYNLLNLHKCE